MYRITIFRSNECRGHTRVLAGYDFFPETNLAAFPPKAPWIALNIPWICKVRFAAYLMCMNVTLFKFVGTSNIALQYEIKK